MSFISLISGRAFPHFASLDGYSLLNICLPKKINTAI